MPLFRSHGKVEKTGRKRKLAFPTELCVRSWLRQHFLDSTLCSNPAVLYRLLQQQQQQQQQHGSTFTCEVT